MSTDKAANQNKIKQLWDNKPCQHWATTHGTLGSLTLTLNLKPTANLKMQPEIRYDYTGYKNGLDGKDNRFSIGAGASDLF